jgi:hypothetical protein
LCIDTPNASNTSRHPKDHLWCAWDAAYHSSATTTAQRPARHFDGKRWAVRETVGGTNKHFLIDFVDPQRSYGLPSPEALKAASGIQTLLTGRIHERDAFRGEMAVAHQFDLLVHNPVTGQTEMRCHFWLGDVAVGKAGLIPASMVERVGNHPWGRRAFAPLSLARAVHRHCFEEMSCLAAVLPVAYAKFKDAPYVPSPAV